MTVANEDANTSAGLYFGLLCPIVEISGDAEWLQVVHGWFPLIPYVIGGSVVRVGRVGETVVYMNCRHNCLAPETWRKVCVR